MRRLLLTAALLAPTGAAAFPFGPLAPADEVKSIVAEMDLPTVLPPAAETPLARVRYPAAALKDYPADVPLAEVRKAENAEKYRLRLAVLDALDEMRAGWANDGRQLRVALPAEITDRTKLDVRREQDPLAVGVPQLEVLRSRLEAYEPRRGAEPKRWQAHFDYALAELTCRLALMAEYNQALGKVRSENLPPLDPTRHAGYRLRPSETMTAGAEVKRQMREARARFEAVEREHTNTPWAVAASRALRQPPGLAWVAEPR
jgi:hypothetical protein